MNTTQLLEKYGPMFSDALQDARLCVNEAQAAYDSKHDATEKARSAQQELLSRMNDNLTGFTGAARMIKSLFSKASRMTVADIDRSLEPVTHYRDALEELPAVNKRLEEAEAEERKAYSELSAASELFNAINKWLKPQ